VPQLVDHAVELDDGPAVHEQEGEEAESSSARDAGGPAGFQVDLDRTEDPELHVHFRSEPIRVRSGL
jgi:hypothetical protein